MEKKPASKVIDLKKNTFGEGYSKAITSKDILRTITTTTKKSIKPMIYGTLIVASFFTLSALRNRNKAKRKNEEKERQEALGRILGD